MAASMGDLETRRDPDAILRQIVEGEAAEGDARGKLKLPLGRTAPRFMGHLRGEH